MNPHTFPVLFLLSITILISCAPVPMIQSSRITGGVGIGSYYTSQSHTIKKTATYTCTPGFWNCDSSGVIISQSTLGEQMEPRTYLRFGIRNRVELITSIQPVRFIIPAIKGNLKVALFELGSKQLFRNVAISIFGGGDWIPTEWDKYKNSWGGLITGTHHTFNSIDLELACMTYGAYFNYKAISDGFPTTYFTYKTANLSLGCIARPFKRNMLELNAGISFRKVFDKKTTISYYYSYTPSGRIEIDRFSVEPVLFQVGLQMYVPDRKKK